MISMLLMLRRLSMFVLVVAALIAAEPLLHNHPLQQNAIPDACAICATGVAPLPSAMPAVSAPQLVAYTIVTVAAPAVIRGASISLPPRAPPSL
jgi:hypothetical protein